MLGQIFGSRTLRRFLFLGVLCLFVAGGMVLETINRLPKPGDRLVEGRIVKVEVKEVPVEMDDKHYIGHESVLTIRIVKTNTNVTTLMPGDWTDKRQTIVKFYYSGDPTKPILLQEEITRPLQNSIGIILLGLLSLLVVFAAIMFYKWQADLHHNEYEKLVKDIK